MKQLQPHKIRGTLGLEKVKTSYELGSPVHDKSRGRRGNKTLKSGLSFGGSDPSKSI